LLDSSFITEISSGDWADDIDLSSYDWNESLFKGIITNSQLTNDQKSKLKILSNKIRNSFAESLKDLGKCTILPYKIKMISDQIVHIPQYRKSIVEQEIIDKKVKEMFDAGIIRISNSPHSSPSLLVNKANGEKRFVIDFRKINSYTVPENLPIPQIRDIFDRVSGAVWFSTFY
jgi:hypothetical protein